MSGYLNPRTSDMFDKAVKLDPNLAEAYSGKGNAHSRLGDYETALAEFGKAVKLNPNLAKAYKSLSDTLCKYDI